MQNRDDEPERASSRQNKGLKNVGERKYGFKLRVHKWFIIIIVQQGWCEPASVGRLLKIGESRLHTHTHIQNSWSFEIQSRSISLSVVPKFLHFWPFAVTGTGARFHSIFDSLSALLSRTTANSTCRSGENWRGKLFICTGWHSWLGFFDFGYI